MYLVDTNVLSEARRGNPEARRWFLLVDPGAVYLSVITLGEIMKGVAMRKRTDARAASSLRAWLERLRLDHADRILPVTDAVALEWGRLIAQRPRPILDLLIAATASVYGMAVVTRNVGDFVDTGVSIINPWQP